MKPALPKFPTVSVRTPPGSPLVLASLAGYGLLSFALFASWGFYSPTALAATLAALLAWAWALFFGQTSSQRDLSKAALWIAWSLAVGFVLACLRTAPGFFADPRLMRAPLLVSFAGAGLVLLSLLPELIGWRPPARLPVRTLRVAALLAFAFASAAWMLKASPRPEIDVWDVHQQGAQMVLEGRLPYGAMEVRSTYHGETITSYPYPPMSLLLTTAAYAAAGDTRWAQLAAMLLAGVLIAALVWQRQPGKPWPEVLTALLLFHPRNLFILEQAWGEPLGVPFLAAFALLVIRRTPAAPISLGLLAAVKQQLLLYLPFAAFLPAIGARGAFRAGLVVVATVAPFLIWNAEALWQDLVVHHLENPFRPDSLSLAAVMVRQGLRPIPAWVGFLAGTAGLAITAKMARSTAAVFLGSALTFGLFFVFGRQALPNYYFLVGATALVAVAVAVRD